jgi:hypothetical protein
MNLSFSEKEIKYFFQSASSKSDVVRSLGLKVNGSSIRFVNKLVEKYEIDISHFNSSKSAASKNKKYLIVEKICPICSEKFKTKKGHIREKVVCSRSCANSRFRSGESNPNYKHDKSKWGYRRLCFSVKKKECVICKFSAVVEVHHLDEDKANNKIENLIPLCPNHHKMIHTKKYEKQIKQELAKALENNRA